MLRDPLESYKKKHEKTYFKIETTIFHHFPASPIEIQQYLLRIDVVR